MRNWQKIVLSVTVVSVSSSFVMANGLSLNNIGPRALGMAGAYVGVAADPTAIYWNPAGLTGQKRSVTFFVTDIVPMPTYKYDPAGIDAEGVTNHYVGPNLMAAYSKERMAFGLGLYVPAGLGAEWEKDDFSGYEMMSKLAVFNISPAFAYKLNDMFSVGVTANIFYGMMEMKRMVDDPLGGAVPLQYSEETSGLGFGAGAGLMCNVNDDLSCGLSLKTPVNVAFEGDADMGALEVDVERDIEWPLWLGVGMSYRVNEKLTVAADGHFCNWSSLEKLETKSTMTIPTVGEVTEDQEQDLNWENALQIRLGCEYQMLENLALRGGYYYDPAPAPDETLNILFPSSTNHSVTTGFGYMMDRFDFDFSLEYLFGVERDIDPHVNSTSGEVENNPGIHQMDLFAFSLGIAYTF